MATGYFVTGTDTGVGKTLIAAALMKQQAALGLRVVGMKPVASGCCPTAAGLRNDDAEQLARQATVQHPYSRINPYAFAPAIAPHLAARAAGVSIELALLVSSYQELALDADIVVVEGAGGWRVPIGPTGLLSDFPEALRLDVILVVGLRLGCLNHALLTCEAIAGGGKSRLVGWVGNGIDPTFSPWQDNIETLRQRIPAPCLGVVPPLATPTLDAVCARLQPLGASANQ
ncbi:MAG: dethiobiotin synthase [Steroidobacteraceae bacterium]